MTPRDAALHALAPVARAFGPLIAEVAFVGGAGAPLLVTDEGAPAARPTDDVDVIVEAFSYRAYEDLAEVLRARGGPDTTTRRAHPGAAGSSRGRPWT